MSRWSVDYKVAGKHSWKNMNGIEAMDGREAIEYVKKHVIGAYKFQCFHDDDNDIDLAREVAFAEVMD